MQPLPNKSHLWVMKQFIFSLILCFPFFTKAQESPLLIADSVKTYLDKSLNIIEQNALNRKSVNWAQLRKNVFIKAQGAQRYEDVLDLYPYIFEQIDDHHGSLKFKGKTYSWNSGPRVPVSAAIQAANKKYTAIRAQKIGRDIGYILIPGNSDFRGQHMDSLTSVIKAAIASVHDAKIKG